MEEMSYGRNIIAATIEQGSGNQRKGMISTQAHLSGLQVETASGGCQLTELTERWVEDLRFYTSPTMMMMMVSPATCGKLIHLSDWGSREIIFTFQ
jgi:hypothetical protein